MLLDICNTSEKKIIFHSCLIKLFWGTSHLICVYTESMYIREFLFMILDLEKSIEISCIADKLKSHKTIFLDMHYFDFPQIVSKRNNDTLCIF